ncbi:hypothetical protein EJB05_30217, partial [Eragrostis curvula]
MTFEDIESAKEFYKAYAGHVGFSVRVGQHKTKDGLLLNKRFYCSREGFRDDKDQTQSEPECGGKRKYERKITRCGCQAMLAIKRTKESKYIITSFVEEHTHAFVSPDKHHLIRSNREVGEKVKTTLFNFHRASIGTSDAYRFLRVGLGGFENVGCTLRDLQNYHGKLRCLIKSSDAQMFVDQLSRKAIANPAFYFDYVIDEKGRLVHVFWADATCRKNYSHFGDLVSFDATYSTNVYDMVFTPFTGVNHHKANMESLFVQAKQSPDAMQLLRDGVFSLGEKISEMVPAKELSTTEEFEEFLGCQIPSQVDIHPPNDIRSKGRIKRIKGHADKGAQQNKNDQKKKNKNKRQPRKCRTYNFRNGLVETAMGVVAAANSENDQMSHLIH